MDKEKNIKRLPLIIGCTILVAVIVTILITEYLIPVISEKTSTWGTAEIAIVISLVAIVAQIAPPFIDQHFDKKNARIRENLESVLEKQAEHYDDMGFVLKKQNETYYAIKLDVTMLDDGNVQFEATIRNKGLVTIHPQYTKLYIDQGIPGNADISEYEFPFILEHKDDTPEGDCILCTRCKHEKGTNDFPIDALDSKFKGLMRAGKLEYGCFALDHLSEKSIKYIRAHEQFQENVILNFKKTGVYRATLVVITHDADCQCATEQFYVKVPSQPQKP